MSDLDKYYEMMETTAAIESTAKIAATHEGWKESTQREGYVNDDGYDNIHAKTWKQLCEDENIHY